MAEPNRYVFNFEEVVEALIKKQGLHEGVWALWVRFGIQGANSAGQGPGEVLPVAIVPILQLGLQAVPEDDKGSMPGKLDAAIVNPKSRDA